MTIHVFGRVFMDLFIYGEKIHNCKIVETPGGSALNASLGFSVLGLPTFIHAAYGRDHNGEFIRKMIDEYGVKTDYLLCQSEPTNRFISKNGKAIAASVASNPLFEIPETIGKDDYCLLFATETGQETVRRVLTIPWKGLFIDLGPKYTYNRFSYKPDKATIIGNEVEAENNFCDVVKMGKKGARWHEDFVPGNGKDLPFTTGAGDLFDVVFIYNIITGKTVTETLKEAISLAQKACMIPGSSTKIQILRDFYHSV
ncbi:MAG: PfkB family carbohydrate kinase [Thermotogota bacterium]